MYPEQTRKSNIKAIYPLSPLQEGILFHYLNDRSVYFEQMSYRLHGALVPALVEETLEILFERHDALRTAIVVEEDRPLQVVLDRREIEFAYTDIAHEDSDASKKALIDAYLHTDRERSFDLKKDVLLRVHLFRISVGLYEFVWSHSHIILDGWCIGILNNEFWEIYGALKDKKPLALPPAPQYSGFIRWLQQQDATAAGAYWKNYLKSYQGLCAIGPQNLLPFSADYKEQVYHFELDAACTQRLAALAVSCQATLNLVLETIWALWLSVSNQTNDVLFGTVVSGRPPELANARDIVGLFINTVPIRVRFNEQEKLADVMKEVQEEALGAYDFHHHPLSGMQWEGKQKQYFDHIWLFENYPVSDNAHVQAQGFHISDVAVTERTNYDFNITVKNEGKLVFRVLFNANRYPEAFIRTVAGNFSALVAVVLENPSAMIAEIKDAFLQRLTTQHTSVMALHTGFPENVTVADLFEHQARTYPGKTAITCNGRALTYAQVEEKANRIAHLLRSHYAVAPGDFVGLMLPRSEQAVVYLLGIIKSGAAYVPIDPDYPVQRTTYMIKDANVRVLITDSIVSEQFPGLTAVATLADIEQALDGFPAHVPEKVNAAEDLLYVIYTSGSTGTPKGVMVTHQNVVRLLFNDAFQFNISHEDVWTLFHSIAFDFSVWEMFGALLYGGRLVVVPQEAARDPKAFVDLLEKEAVTVLNQIPTIFASVSAEVMKRPRCNLKARYVVFGGEALLPEILKDWHTRFPQTRLVNMYGITETTVHVTYKEILAADITSGSSNIGQPLPTLDMYILNDNMQQMPYYSIGEICVTGYGLAVGYLNNKSLTEERFVPSPFSGGQRIYKSGDLGYRTTTGDIIYAGRKDDQVKIRGYRIETGEIENWILRYKGVTSVAVIGSKDKAGDNILVAFLVSDEKVDVNDLRAFLRSGIPEFMIPAVSVQLKALPFTASGKIDKKALSALGWENRDTSDVFQPPAGHVEKTIAGIWESVLGVCPIGRQHDFFNVGGDSVKAIRVVAQINRALGTEIEVKDIFGHSLLGELAAHIESLAAEPDSGLYTSASEEIAEIWSAIRSDHRQAALLPASAEDGYPMSDIEQGMIYHSLLGRDAGIYIDQLYYQFAEETFSEPALMQALLLLTEKHEILRTSFNYHDFSVPMQIVHSMDGFTADLTIEDISHLSSDGQREYLTGFLQENRARLFDFSKPGLWWVVVFRLSAREYGMLWVCHHAILDGWSMAALMTELSNVYIACRDNQAGKLSPLSCSYRDYVVNQLVTARKVAIQDYWKQQLNGYRRHQLPFGRKPLSVTAKKQALGYERQMGPEVAEKINSLATLTGANQREIFLAAFLFLVWMTTNQEEIITGLVTHGRPEMTDGDAVLGCFLNTVPFRFQFNRDRTCRELMDEVRERCRELKANDKLSLAKISALFSESGKQENPFFDVLFNYVDFHVYNHFNAGIDNKQTLINHTVSTNTYLDFNVEKRDAALLLCISYEGNLYQEAEIALLADYYLRILNLMYDGPATVISAQAVLNLAEKQRLLLAYNDNTTNYPREAAISALFEEQAARTPDDIAVVGDEGILTYRELNERSNQLAYYLLQHHRPAKDELIGIMTERSSLWVPVTMLAILKTGAAYLPVDSTYPEARINHMLQDSGVKLLITGQAGYCLPGQGVTLALPEIQYVLDRYATGNPGIPIRSTDLAYVMYTSGSTGKPKGVMIEQRSVVRLVKETNYYHFSTNDSLLLTGALSFDATTFEIWGMLLNGGRLHLVPYDVLLDIRRLRERLQQWKISVMWFTSSWFNQLVEEDISLFEGLRTILVGGDRLSPAHIRMVKDAFPSLAIINGYGPTENTTFSVCYPVQQVNGEAIPIGYPVSNTRVYVLDNHFRLLPENVEGDIYLAGDGLARGYLGDAADNAARFFNCTLADDVPVRLYKTGDVGKWLPGGLLEFLGRKDNEVKIRGFRIETAEIEYYLNQHTSVRSSYVMVAEKAENKTLVAYLVASPDLTAASLRAYLASLLPDYMIPVTYLNVESFPLDGNGKLDRAALQQLPAVNLETATGTETARDHIEVRLMNIWKQVLGRDGFGVNANFFDLGGNSLSIIKLHNQVSEAFDAALSVADFFKYNTISQMGAYLRGVEKPVAVSGFDV